MIGVFDSGLGGLSVLAAIARVLPRADLVYYADSAHVPWGDKSESFITSRVLGIGRQLHVLGCQTIVVACNTATTAAIQSLRAALPGTPIVGVEPGVKPALATTRSGHIAVLATEATAKSARLRQLIAQHAGQKRVTVTPCPGWATHVETLQAATPEFRAEVAARVLPLLAEDVDRLVLGCTHYAFLKPILLPLIAGRAELIDVADAVARQVVRLYRPSPEGSHGTLQLMASARPERLRTALPALGLAWLAERAVIVPPADAVPVMPIIDHPFAVSPS